MKKVSYAIWFLMNAALLIVTILTWGRNSPAEDALKSAIFLLGVVILIIINNPFKKTKLEMDIKNLSGDKDK